MNDVIFGLLEKSKGENTLHEGQLEHFHDIYQKYTPRKCIAFDFGFHFWCLGFIF